jgi:hypothetical protein
MLNVLSYMNGPPLCYISLRRFFTDITDHESLPQLTFHLLEIFLVAPIYLIFVGKI